MNVNTVELENNTKVYIVENTLDQYFLELAHNICNTYYSDRSQWYNPEWTNLRFIHGKASQQFQELNDCLKSGQVHENMENLLGKKLQFGEAQLWCDLPGYGPLAPHVESSGELQGQLYLTSAKDHQYINYGTTIHNLDKKVLFTLPYRDNLSWIFEDCQKVMHGRETDVPKNLERFALIFWYNYYER
jgi:hypothetical protein